MREKRRMEEERWEKIRKSKFNKWYGRIKEKRVPGCLRKEWKKKRWQRMAKFRLRDGLTGNRYWEREEEKMCRVCKEGKETWKHIWEEFTNCGVEKGWQKMVNEVLGEEREGEEWYTELKKLDEMRKRKKEKNTAEMKAQKSVCE